MTVPVQFARVSPVFPVRDLEAALAHYASLGFETSGSNGGERYAFADRDGVHLHLAEAHEHDHDHGHEPGEEPEHDHRFAAVHVYLYVDDADALYAEWSRPGIGGTTHHPCDRPYGLREGAHVDQDGNLLRFGSRLKGAVPDTP